MADHIKTERLLLTLADINDLPALERIEKECDDYFDFDPACENNHNCPLNECLTMGDIPPGVDKEDFKKDNYFFYCVWQNDDLIGFLTYYLEYKQKDTAYLSVLYIKESCRRNGVGAEIIKSLEEQLSRAGFKAIRLHCSLRNATGLRFWAKNGFDRIVDIQCDGNLYPENFGGVELMKLL